MVAKEYLFIDKRRVDSYFEQLSSPVKYEKVSARKLIFGFPKISVETSANSQGRPFTTHEKIEKLLDAYRQELTEDSKEKSRYKDRGSFYYLQNALAQKILVPKTETTSQLTMWIVREENAAFYLIEDVGAIDGESARMSGRSTLEVLLWDFQKELNGLNKFLFQLKSENKEFNLNIPAKDMENIYREEIFLGCLKQAGLPITDNYHRVRYSGGNYHRLEIFDGQHYYEISGQNSENPTSELTIIRNAKKEVLATFAANPVPYLEKWGAQASVPRKIESLVKRRSSFIEETNGGGVLTGYPIFIAEE